MDSIRVKSLVFFLFLAGLLVPTPLRAQDPIETEGTLLDLNIVSSPCDEAIDQYQLNQFSIQDLSIDCVREAGPKSDVTWENCPSVDYKRFISLRGKLEQGHGEVCQLCGTWPKELGDGHCLATIRVDY